MEKKKEKENNEGEDDEGWGVKESPSRNMSLAFGGGFFFGFGNKHVMFVSSLAHARASKSGYTNDGCYRSGVEIQKRKMTFVIASQKHNSLWTLALTDDPETSVFGRCMVVVCLVSCGCRCWKLNGLVGFKILVCGFIFRFN